jgi:hypothetical protein
MIREWNVNGFNFLITKKFFIAVVMFGDGKGGGKLLRLLSSPTCNRNDFGV